MMRFFLEMRSWCRPFSTYVIVLFCFAMQPGHCRCGCGVLISNAGKAKHCQTPIGLLFARSTVVANRRHVETVLCPLMQRCSGQHPEY